MLELTSGPSAYVSHSAWGALDHDAKVVCLRLLADRAWVQGELDRAQTQARRAVERRWLSLGRNVTSDEIALFHQERTSAAEAAIPAFWQGVAGREGRCAHAASTDGCRVKGCDNQWRPPPPPGDRYFTGGLRAQILDRDDYRCQYCGKRVWDNLPRDHPDKANIDHVIPYPEGPTTLENGKTACSVCNALKGARDWFPEVTLDDL